MYFDQSRYRVKFEWGLRGLEGVGPDAGAIVIVDVLSFSTCVDIALGRRATVLPYRWRDESAEQFAAERGALLAAKRRSTFGQFSLSPESLLELPAGAKLVLPSPNGSTLSLRAAELATAYSACLRNATAVARAVDRSASSIAVIAAGEKWEDDSLRAAIEDMLGAGALIAQLGGTKSPEAIAAESLFRSVYNDLGRVVTDCSSGRELIEQGYSKDVDLAVQLNVSEVVPILRSGEFVDAQG